MVRSALGRRVGERAGVKVLINERHKECLTRARESLIRGLGALRRADSAELVAEDLKQAVVALGEINGQEVSSQVIDQIFSRFCVGK
jgi:tRNA modification GTPase